MEEALCAEPWAPAAPRCWLREEVKKDPASDFKVRASVSLSLDTGPTFR